MAKANPKLSAPIDQEKADQYQQRSTPMTLPSTCHHPITTPDTLHHGRELLQGVPHTAAYLVLQKRAKAVPLLYGTWSHFTP